MKSIAKNKGVRHLFLAAAAMLACFAAELTAGTPANGRSSRTLRSMARTYIAFGRYDEAETLAQEALARSRMQDDDAELAMCLIDLGTVCQYQNKLDKAEEMLTAGIALQKRAAETNPYMPYTLRMLSSVHRRQQRYAHAQAVLEEAVALMTEEYAPDDPALAFFSTEQAKLLADQGRLDEAREIYSTALLQVEAVYGPGHLCTANVCEETAELDLKLGRTDDAQTQIDRAIGIREKYHGPGHTATVAARFLKARICRAAGDAAGCEQQIEKALAAAATMKDLVQLARLHQQAAAIRNDVRLARL